MDSEAMNTFWANLDEYLLRQKPWLIKPNQPMHPPSQHHRDKSSHKKRS
jgi:hypothetical protein